MKKLVLFTAAFLLFAGINAQTAKDLKGKDGNDNSVQKDILYKVHHGNITPLKKMIKEEVDINTRQQFLKDFGNVPNVKWTNSEYYSEANFAKDGHLYTALYDENSRLVGTTSERPFSDLPEKAKEFINQKYPGYHVGDVIFFDDSDLNETDFFIFNVQVDDEDAYYVELKKDNNKIVLQVMPDGKVYYFTRLF